MSSKHARDDGDGDDQPTSSKRARTPLSEPADVPLPAKNGKVARAKPPAKAVKSKPKADHRRKAATENLAPTVVPRVSSRIRKPSQGARRGTV